MSEEFCDGVKILLKRMESNPEEFKGADNKWHNLIPKGSGGYVDWNHALTEEETKALAEGMRKIHRTVYTEKVMSTLLYSTEDLAQVQPGTWVNVGHAGGGGSGLLGQGVSIDRYKAGAIHPLPTDPYQNAYQIIDRTNTEVKKPTLGEMLKQKLAIL
jgi:hypothetical protein